MPRPPERPESYYRRKGRPQATDKFAARVTKASVRAYRASISSELGRSKVRLDFVAEVGFLLPPEAIGARDECILPPTASALLGARSQTRRCRSIFYRKNSWAPPTLAEAGGSVPYTIQ